MCEYCGCQSLAAIDELAGLQPDPAGQDVDAGLAGILAVARLILTGVLSGQAELLDDLRASPG